MAKAEKLKGSLRERTSMYFEPSIVWTLKYIALMEDKTQTDIINEALADYFTKWEKKKGPVPPKA